MIEQKKIISNLTPTKTMHFKEFKVILTTSLAISLRSQSHDNHVSASRHMYSNFRHVTSKPKSRALQFTVSTERST